MHYVLQIVSLGIATILMLGYRYYAAKTQVNDLTFQKTIIVLDYLLPRADAEGNSGQPNEEMGRLKKILAAKKGSISLAEVDASNTDQHPEVPLADDISKSNTSEKADPLSDSSYDYSSDEEDEDPPRKIDPPSKPSPLRKSVEPDPQPLKPPPVKPVPPKKVDTPVEPEPPPRRKMILRESRLRQIHNRRSHLSLLQKLRTSLWMNL
ncbi:MAG: hypothetical protein LBI34_00835 [Puniceicoccales bacterium]|nr:hypothetical protein [Puniceicoccales bacterium]